MRTTANGDLGNGHIRRLRIDRRPGGASAKVLGGAHSGRLFLVAAALGLLVVSGALGLMFRDWRARYRALADYGARQVAPTIDALADHVPPGVKPKQWEDAVSDTHAMLVAVTGAGLLDRQRMEALRSEVAARVAHAEADPGSAVYELARLWDDMEAKAGPILLRDTSRPPHPPKRPSLLPRPKSTKQTKDRR
jgi:hypothetical protein